MNVRYIHIYRHTYVLPLTIKLINDMIISHGVINKVSYLIKKKLLISIEIDCAHDTTSFVLLAIFVKGNANRINSLNQ